MNVSPTPEPSRKYIQWKEEDIGLLLTDLEQPGHYGKWRENKSGYSKRAAEQIFNNSVNHETIKFKIRWLESRFQRWHEQMTSPNADQQAIREKMTKEFPYYDRCKKIFDLQYKHSIIIHDDTPTALTEQHPMKPEPTPTAITNNSEPNNTLSLTNIEHNKKRNYTLETPSTSLTIDKKLKSIDTSSMTPDYNLKIMEMELECKKMDHQERMQEMKLEQLKLEIELQKLKRDSTTM